MYGREGGNKYKAFIAGPYGQTPFVMDAVSEERIEYDRVGLRIQLGLKERVLFTF